MKSLRKFEITWIGTAHRAGPWHRRNRQMLGVPPIHRGAKMSGGFFITFFLLPILLQYYKFKMLHKKDRPTKTTSSVRTFTGHIFILSPYSQNDRF